MTGESGNVLELTTIFTTKAQAMHVVQAKWDRITHETLARFIFKPSEIVPAPPPLLSTTKAIFGYNLLRQVLLFFWRGHSWTLRNLRGHSMDTEVKDHLLRRWLSRMPPVRGAIVSFLFLL